MKLRYTPLTLAAIALLLYAVYAIATADYGNPQPWGAVLGAMAAIAGVLAFAIDWALHRYVKNKLLITISGLLLIGGTYAFLSRDVPVKTIVLPEGFKGHCTIVYGVKGAPQLADNGTIIKLPSSGVLFTSTRLPQVFERTEFKTSTGQLLNNSPNAAELHAHPFDGGKFVCAESIWEYETWLLNHKTGYNRAEATDTLTHAAIVAYCTASGSIQ